MRTLLAACAAFLTTCSFAGDLTCPIMKSPAPAGSPEAVVAGHVVRFCCHGCDEQFLKSPEKLLASMTGSQALAEFLFDPVSRMRINASEAKAERVYRGRRFYFFTAANAEAFDALPEVYAAVPSRENLVCPVMKNPVASHSAASGYADHGGVRHYFCCAGCEKPFEQDPSKYVAAVAGSVRALTSTEAGSPAQVQIAPTCAGCAGEARILGANGIPAKWTLSYRWVNIDTEIGARHRFTLDYAVNPRLSVGIERALSDHHHHNRKEGSIDRYLKYSDGETDLMPRAAWFITPEGAQHPSLVVGMASDRLSTMRGQAFFLTAAKKVPGTIFTPFVSVKTNSYDGRTVFPFGVNAAVRPDWVVQAINDGDYSHFLLTHIRQGAAYSLLLARGRHIGFGVSYGF